MSMRFELYDGGIYQHCEGGRGWNVMGEVVASAREEGNYIMEALCWVGGDVNMEHAGFG